jgi:hypothetical protein
MKARNVVGVVGVLVLGFACSDDPDGPGDPGAGGDASIGTGARMGDGGADAPSSGGMSQAGQSGGGTPSVAGHSGGGDDEGGGAGCAGVECEESGCDDAETRISGVVLDPSGQLPIYNALVYIPSGDVPELMAGAVCDRCDNDGVPSVASAVTGVDGSFVLEGAPVGEDIPLVIQLGKWRRQITVPVVEACMERPLDAEQTRLPRSRAEGDIPRIAIVAGSQDELECLPRRLGIADSEYTLQSGSGRINLFAGGGNASPGITKYAATLNEGATLPAATQLWSSLATLEPYDLVLLGCEGGTVVNEKPLSARQAMYDYASKGGRVLATHWQHVWLSEGPPPLPNIATWENQPDPGDGSGDPVPGTVNTSFAKGQAFADWLVEVGASETAGTLAVPYPHDNVGTINESLAREWLSVATGSTGSSRAIQHLSATAPIDAPAAEQCGRFALSALHLVSDEISAGPKPPFPNNCATGELSDIEKAAAFQLFELASCIGPDDAL